MPVTPAGGKLWRLKYSVVRKENSLVIGVYPTVRLADARRACDEAKRAIAEGRDLAPEKKQREDDQGG